jgi:N6-L-threonylcarbamoyladenine synthase
MFVLGIETSCDETAAAVVKDGREILASKVYSQIKAHQKWGGVVPELASREHLLLINKIIQESLNEANLSFNDLDLIAVTQGPGLLGSLLVGINTAKTLAWLHEKEIVGVNHLHGHICANFLNSNYEAPFLCLLVSGGHTQILKVDDYVNFEILGETIDDACGEAFDKVAKLLDLPYPGGPELDKLAQTAQDTFCSDEKAKAKSILHGRYSFPIAQVDALDFSFSGLKTAVLRLKQSIPEELWQKDKAKIALAFQNTVSKTLLRKLKKATEQTGYKKIVIAGGVAANSTIRADFEEEFSPENGFELSKPELKFCTDNAAMIASAGYFKYQAQKKADKFNFEAFVRA